MLLMKIIAASCDSNTEHVNTLSGNNAELLVLYIGRYLSWPFALKWF